MKKKILSFILLFAVTFGCASGCKKEDTEGVLVSDGKEVIATINGVNYAADDLYLDMLNDSSTPSYLYETLEDLLIKSVVDVTESMKSRINNEIDKWKKDVKENAAISGTSYKDALESALLSEGVSSEEELYENKMFALQKEIITNQYWNNNKDKYYSDYLENRYIYHISQILVSVGTNGDNDYFDVEITSDVAKKLYNVSKELLSGKSFYQVAQTYSDDTTSKANGGELGIVSLYDTSIPDEVRYALANYSMYNENAEILHDSYLDNMYYSGAEAIPELYVDMLGDKYEESVAYLDDSSTVSLTSRVYARNIIFNSLYNSRTYKVLASSAEGDNLVQMEVRNPNLDTYGYSNTKENAYVVANDVGYPILVVRSDKGIHFISIRKTAFASAEELNAYYSKDAVEGNKSTYLGSAFDSSDYTARKNVLDGLANEYATMKVANNSNLAGNEKYIRYDMFLSYLNNRNFRIVNEEIKQIVLDYISNQKSYMNAKIDNLLASGYDALANKEEIFENPSSDEDEDAAIHNQYTKEVPLLKCLDNKSCTYSYTNGFKKTAGGDE